MFVFFLWKWNFKLSEFKGEGDSFLALPKYVVNCCSSEADFLVRIISCLLLRISFHKLPGINVFKEPGQVTRIIVKVKAKLAKCAL